MDLKDMQNYFSKIGVRTDADEEKEANLKDLIAMHKDIMKDFEVYEVTGWTHWDDDKYVDPNDERMNHNPERKLFPDDRSIMKDEKAYSKWREEMEKIPFWIDEEKVKELSNIEDKCYNCVLEHCKKTGILFSADYHQGGEDGVPIINNKWILQLSMRSWGQLMADVKGYKDPMGYVDYYLDIDDALPHKYPHEAK